MIQNKIVTIVKDNQFDKGWTLFHPYDLAIHKNRSFKKVDVTDVIRYIKNYVITDDLCTVLKQFDSAFKFGKNVENQTLTDGVKELLSQHASLGTIHQDILEMVRNIKEHGQYITTRSRQISEVYEEEYETLSSRLIERSQGAWDSDVDTIREKLMQVSREAQNTVNKANVQLRDGTAKLIYTRARQLGYAVQEMKKGMQTQLVLVRCE
ncbi:MAG TPA: hypothetical protein P5543_05510 [Planctomycetota bacterium]|nr:hypothetical protein [Planctomycetota bacterium]HRU51631.1 hypothetical protein [Planctomycetota bacterium]